MLMKMASPAAHSEAPRSQPSAAASMERAFDHVKVARMADAIADGSFQANAEAIADRLLANAQRLASQAGLRRASGMASS